MKRFLLSMLLCSGITILPAALALHTQAHGALALHAPAQGNLQLGDNGHAAGIQRGVIMDTIITNPNFANEEIAIAQFLGIPLAQPINFSYQQIMQRVQQSTDAAQAITVIEAFEKALMHQYHYDTYAVGSYQPWQSIFFTGIKYSWMNPAKWINPTYWISDNDPNLNQIMNEMAFLGRAAYKHSYVTSKRISATVESYRHWRRNMALTVVAYFAADAYKHGLNESSLHDLYAGGLTSGPVITAKLVGNLYSGSKFATTTATACAQYAYSATKPIVNLVLFGAENKKPELPSIVPQRFRNWWNKKTNTPEQEAPKVEAHWKDYFKDTAASYAKQVQDRFNGKPQAE